MESEDFRNPSLTGFCRVAETHILDNLSPNTDHISQTGHIVEVCWEAVSDLCERGSGQSFENATGFLPEWGIGIHVGGDEELGENQWVRQGGDHAVEWHDCEDHCVEKLSVEHELHLVAVKTGRWVLVRDSSLLSSGPEIEQVNRIVMLVRVARSLQTYLGLLYV